MPNELDPLIDQWYLHLDKGQRFFITAINDDAGTIEIQHFDGDIEECTLKEWKQMEVELSVAPENWSGAVDVGLQDDFGTEVTDTNKADWDEPLTEFPGASEKKLAPEPETLEDDYGEGELPEEPLE